jgi:hypothetical protein
MDWGADGFEDSQLALAIAMSLEEAVNKARESGTPPPPSADDPDTLPPLMHAETNETLNDDDDDHSLDNLVEKISRDVEDMREELEAVSREHAQVRSTSASMTMLSAPSTPLSEPAGGRPVPPPDPGSSTMLTPPPPLVPPNQAATRNATPAAKPASGPSSRPLRLVFSLALLARRALAGDSGAGLFRGTLISFLDRVNALFRGDVRVTATRDEWVFADVSLLNLVSDAARLALQMHLDFFELGPMKGEELYDETMSSAADTVTCSEEDPAWRAALSTGVKTAISLRRVTDSYQDTEHFIVRLNKRTVKFRVVRFNREAVRGLWAGQQGELVYFGNTNAERGSIQQLTACTRNLINQSCDSPIGYPTFVSPLVTSFSIDDERTEGE